ncbi:MAG TPA: hypothetical protein ENI73_03845 [Spirochaetes bacterium]|nr:hypothetical protein [Spirochaetota bacterium]
MRKTTKLLMIVASLTLIILYFVPFWKISLLAPQYPEYPDGLQIRIGLTSLTGGGEHHLEIIDLLNHYIGMRTLPKELPDFSILPYYVALMILFGLISVAVGDLILKKRRLEVINLVLIEMWVSFFAIIGMAGIWGFYLRGYEYAHNLDMSSPLAKAVLGMNYEPPLIGSKQLLNITAQSLPDIGGYILFLSFALGSAAFFYELISYIKYCRRKKEQ